MTNRIYELAAQAGLITFESIHDSMSVTPNLESVAKANKFAKLLVLEASTVALECGVNLNREDFRQGISRSIKQHFGVEVPDDKQNL